MARVDAPITYTPWVNKDGRPTAWFYQFINSLWVKTGGSIDESLSTVQVSTATSYTVTGQNGHEIVTCTNASGVDITITLATLAEKDEVTVIRKGAGVKNAGGVTIDGNGATILGESTQTLPLQYDAPHMLALSDEWGLI